MSYIRHHAIVVTSWDHDAISQALMVAEELGCQPSPLLPATTNGYRSFLVPPDGSKEGWSESNDGNDRRDALVAHMGTQCHDDGSGPLAWVEVQFGDDNWSTTITRDSDAQHRAGRMIGEQ